MTWTGEHCTFAAVESFSMADESVNAEQKAFRTHFILLQNYAVPDRKLMLLWVEIFKTKS